MKTSLIITVTLTVLLIATTLVLAQPPGLPATPSQAPIDGGLSLLAAAGGAYVYKKLRGRNQQNRD